MHTPILITGGTQRLGLAIAEHFINSGQSVIITYRTYKPAVENLIKQGATLIQCDFMHENAVDKLITDIKALSPKLRGIIHNASDWDAEPNDTPSPDILEKMMKVHVHAPYRINWALKDALHLNKQEHTTQFSDIIHMTDYVQETGSAKHIAYSASKAALHNLTLSFAKKLSPHVKVNSIAPALVMFNEWDDQNYRDKAKSKSLLQAVPGADEAVKAVDYLFKSDYVTGQTLHLNGGRHLK